MDNVVDWLASATPALSVVATILAATATLLSYLHMLRKSKASKKLSVEILKEVRSKVQGRQDLTELISQLQKDDPEKLREIQGLFEVALASLSREYQSEARSALQQPSTYGRRRYMAMILADAAEHMAAERH